MSSQVSPIIPTSSSMAPPIAGGAASQNPVRFAHNVSNQVISVSPSSLSAGGSSKTLAAVAAMPGQSSSTVEPPPSSTILKPSTPSPLVGATTPGVVPALTDEQKQIILDFKQSMVGLTPEARDKFIAQHKGRLMEKLNFQPKQLKSLRSNQAAVVGGAGTSPAGASLPTAPQPMTTNIPAGKPPAAVLRGAVPPLNPLPGQSSKHNAPLPPGIVSQLQNPQSMPGLGSQMSPMPPGLANLKPQKISIGTPGTGAAMPRLEDASVMMLPSVPTSSGINNGGSSALKRPLSGTEPTMPIHTKIRWVESQLGKDQNEVLNPQYKVRFKDKEDSCKKLLRFHVYHELDVSPEQIEKEEVQIESKATELMDKYNTMLNKYHYLLLQESMVSWFNHCKLRVYTVYVTSADSIYPCVYFTDTFSPCLFSARMLHLKT